MSNGPERQHVALNALCPYFTMFPLSFPHSILLDHARQGERVIDPFCGRGTTLYAARLCGLEAAGIDSNPVAIAIAEGKLASTRPEEIMESAMEVFADAPETVEVPTGEFWDWAFHPEVLRVLCVFRQAFMTDCRSDARKALRAVMMGALHGPMAKHRQSYFSNQAQRTYAPKPAYAVRFWTAHGIHPPKVDVFDIISLRATRYFGNELPTSNGIVIHGDSTVADSYAPLESKYGWVITSPPYYGMRTYLPDQWLRLWFVGGPPVVLYANSKQIEHTSQSRFAQQLQKVWKNVGSVCSDGAHMIVRFGAINDRKVDPIELLEASLVNTGWEVTTIHPAGSASEGRRQALHFSRVRSKPLEEFDIWCTRTSPRV